ncbi:MAG: Rieske 2Fe-2S domain-containing protein [Thermoguttaceae bacterium]|jgi:cytochrome b6-f complex iron-sulfur subunit|nr:Rieske 2Fe-2S domain-containing protein [Thermoguttaceae bacterium]
MTPTTARARSRLDPEPVPRRDFLGIASLVSFVAAMLFATIGMLRLPKAAVLGSPAKKFRVTLPDALAEGEAFVPPGRSVAVFRDREGLYAISLVCTHLGCIVKPGPSGFDCPCHGSQFAADGSVVRGPAPKALPWHAVTVRGRECVVDEGAVVPAGTKVSA